MAENQRKVPHFPGKRAFKELRYTRCFENVREMLDRGEPCTEVARFIQEDQGELTNKKRDTLVETLRQYRKAFPPGIRALVGTITDKELWEKLQGHVNVLDEINSLYAMQKERIITGFKHEVNKGKLSATGSKEMETAVKILTEIKETEMDLGLVKREPKKVDIALAAKAEIERDLKTPEQRKRVVEAMGRIMRVLEGRKKEGEKLLKGVAREGEERAEVELKVVRPHFGEEE